MFKSNDNPLSVSQVNRHVRTWLEQDIGSVAILGEISNLSKPASGHYYFTLKDESAQLRAVFFYNYHNQATKQFRDGQQVIAQGRLSLYEARGEYQLIVHELNAAGLGELYKQFELLKQKLELQGLFQAEHKKPIKRFPQQIAIITSGTGAALRDMLTTLARRYPIAKILLIPCDVQGKNAAPQIIEAIKKVNRVHQAETILLARGGGSIEDLWSFNNEQLAYAIHESVIPIITGIGHETDFTIADFVADLRAATPTAAAEAATPDKAELHYQLSNLNKQLYLAIKRNVIKYQWQLTHQQTKLASPKHLILTHWQTLDYLEKQKKQLLRQTLQLFHTTLTNKIARLHYQNPLQKLQHVQTKLTHLIQQLDSSIEQHLRELKRGYTTVISTLSVVNPLATLDRGYALATYEQKVLTDCNSVSIGDRITVQLAKGALTCDVVATRDTV